jgi:hypothetical protein
MATVQTQQIREERWRENYKDDGSSRMKQTGDQRSGIYEDSKTTQAEVQQL